MRDDLVFLLNNVAATRIPTRMGLEKLPLKKPGIYECG
jgi:hypothetical protein